MPLTYVAFSIISNIYASPWVATPLMPPSRLSLSKAWPTIIPYLHRFISCNISRYLRTYQLVLLLFGHVAFWRSLARFLFHECSTSLMVMSCIIHPSPSFGACTPRVGDFRIMSGQISIAQRKSVKVSQHEIQPSCELNTSGWPRWIFIWFTIFCFFRVHT